MDKRPYQVLIIEDDLTYAKPLVTCLKEGGYDVLESVNRVSQAKDRIEKYKPEILIVDLQLEDGNGLELLNHLGHGRENYNPYIIVLTSFITAHTLAYFKKHHYFHYPKNEHYHPRLILDNLVAIKGIWKNEVNNLDLRYQENASRDVSLEKIILAEINRYNFSPKWQAKEYLQKVIYYILETKEPGKLNLSEYYELVGADFMVEPKAISIGISRLIRNAFLGENADHAFRVFYGDDLRRGENGAYPENAPTNKEFILQVVENIKNEK